MARSSFVMRPTKNNISRYMLLILFPPVLLITFGALLIEYDVFPANSIYSRVLLVLACAYSLITTFYFIINKQCTLEIKNHAIKKTNIFGTTVSQTKAKQIYYTRQNILNELLLYDEHGNLLLCVSPHLENRILFDEWLLDHDIRC